MSFRLVPKSVTLNDLERRNGPYSAFFSPNSVAFAPHCVKCFKIYVNFQRQECSKKFTFAISSSDEFLSF